MYCYCGTQMKLKGRLVQCEELGTKVILILACPLCNKIYVSDKIEEEKDWE